MPNAPKCYRCGTPLPTLAEYDKPCPKAKRAKHHGLKLAQWCKLKGAELESRRPEKELDR